MKKIYTLILLLSMASGMGLPAFSNTADYTVKAPIWEEYAPEGYTNPRSFPSKGKNVTELAVGAVLTELLLTAPIGIPMVCHAATKMKNQRWYVKKQTFEAGLKEAETITDPVQKQEYYNYLLRKCKLTEKMRQKKLQKMNKV